jgi:hypothetical protein
MEIITRRIFSVQSRKRYRKETDAHPPLQHIEKIAYNRPRALPLVTPDFIFHSRKLKLNVAVCLGIYESVYDAIELNKKREWLPIESISTLDSSSILIYVDSNPYNIALIADAKYICRPDLILECREEKRWDEKDGHMKIIQTFESLKPKLGTYVITRYSAPDTIRKELLTETVVEKPVSAKTFVCSSPETAPHIQGSSIHILNNAFDQLALEPVIDSLMPLKQEAKQPSPDSKKSEPLKKYLALAYNIMFKKEKKRKG